jgi:NodT family efflux transporter outer membrane factor (OMF) lipoprotein
MRIPLYLPLKIAALVLALTGCAVGPGYQPPPVEAPIAFKEGQGEWVKAVPADTLERGPWWRLFNDSVLDQLESQVEVSNQNVAFAVAAYAQARALVAEQRAAMFPVVNLGAGANRIGGAASVSGTRNSYQVNIGGTWEPDVWGRLGRAVTGAQAAAQASQADLQSARLSAQGELAVDYFNLRVLDSSIALQAQTIAGYQRNLRITQNRYSAGIVPRTDTLQAQTQLSNAQADLLGLAHQRAVLEHAIAVLMGKAPADFNLAPLPDWAGTVPDVPIGVPTTLLQRRPDVAAAERRAAQANEQIGIARAAYFPSFQLSGSAGVGAAAVGDLFRASSLAWSLGFSLAQTVLDAGARSARVDAAQAALDQAAAQYRQTALAAFQAVEDQLNASHILQQQLVLRQEALDAANRVEQQTLNRYQAGQVNYTEVITAQVTAQSARRAVYQALADRHVAAVSLIQALGGGWRGLDVATH